MGGSNSNMGTTQLMVRTDVCNVRAVPGDSGRTSPLADINDQIAKELSDAGRMTKHAKRVSTGSPWGTRHFD
jgi:hypothetical protein